MSPGPSWARLESRNGAEVLLHPELGLALMDAGDDTVEVARMDGPDDNNLVVRGTVASVAACITGAWLNDPHVLPVERSAPPPPGQTPLEYEERP